MWAGVRVSPGVQTFFKENVMKIKVNCNNNVIDVPEPYLEVRDRRLYNNVTKQYEGHDGELASFILKHEDGKVYEHRGTIDGYTCSGRVKFRGNDTVYTGITNLSLERISVVIGQEVDAVEYSLVFS